MRKEIVLGLFLALVSVSAAAPALAASHEAFVQKIEAAYVAKKPYPLASQEIKDLSVEKAYEVQRAFVAAMVKKGEKIAGFKAGLTAEPVQTRFGMKEPVYGTLFASMLRKPGTVRLKDFSKMFIETEIGFRFKKDILKPVKDTEELKSAVAIAFPAVELPDVSYTDMKALKGTDLIASNVAGRKVLIGKAAPFKSRDLNQVKVTLTLDGKEVTSGFGKNALGDQWEALKWTVNNVLANGGEIKEGHIVITGVLSKIVPASAGAYKADYGDFGSIEFVCK